MQAPHIHVAVEPERFVSELNHRQIQGLRDLIPPKQVVLERAVRTAYGHDESPVHPAIPAAVVFVESAAQVARVLNFADLERLPVTPRGAGTSKVGGAIPLYGGIVLALERMHRVLQIHPTSRFAQIEPGVITATLREAADDHGLYYPVDPNSLDSCTLGGNVAANAAGPSSMKYGATREQILGLEVVLASGERLELGHRTTKSATGYDLTHLFIGSEGTLGVVTGITCRLRARPTHHRTVFATFADSREAVATLSRLYGVGLEPCAAEFFDAFALEAMGAAIAIREGAQAGLLLELDGIDAGLEEGLEKLMVALGPAADGASVARDEAARRRLWEARKQVSVRVKARYKRWVSEDVTVPPGRLPEMVAQVARLRRETGLDILCYGHAGDGNLHVNFLYQEAEQHDAVEAAVERLFRAVVALDGTLSGEHGIGASKRRFLPLEQRSHLIGLQRRFKTALDPHGILNPGKVFP